MLTVDDLRHACLSTWLNGGVAPAQVAEWAGHSVEVLLRTYARCLDGQHDIAKRRIMEALDDRAREGVRADAISETATAELAIEAGKVQTKMASVAGSSLSATRREPQHVFSTDSHGWPVLASANRIPPDSASPNVVLSGSEETPGQ